MKFIRINLKNLHNEEWFTLHIIFRDLILKYGAETLDILDLFNLLKVLLVKADLQMVILRKSVYTAEMEKAAKERNALVRVFFEAMKAARIIEGEARRKAVEKLFVLLSEYKKIILDKSYAESESSVYNLLQDLRSPGYAPAVTLVGLIQEKRLSRQSKTGIRQKAHL